MNNKIVAIDGPAGAGKTTLAKLLAEKTGLLYIDTGAMYRSLTWKVLKLNIDFGREDLIIDIARRIDIQLKQENRILKIFTDGYDVTDEIRSPEVTAMTHHVAKIKEVREEMVKIQRKMGKNGGVIMEGRDIGTVVFPRADKKIYLDAELDERAKRRFEEMKAKGYNTTLSQLKSELIERDERDKNRAYGPLKMASDSIYFNTTKLTIPEMVEAVLGIIDS